MSALPCRSSNFELAWGSIRSSQSETNPVPQFGIASDPRLRWSIHNRLASQHPCLGKIPKGKCTQFGSLSRLPQQGNQNKLECPIRILKSISGCVREVRCAQNDRRCLAQKEAVVIYKCTKLGKEELLTTLAGSGRDGSTITNELTCVSNTKTADLKEFKLSPRVTL
jgi:hypothetical protein